MSNAPTKTAVETVAAVHPFERKGLGKGPFKFTGMGQQDRLYGEVILNRAEYEKTGIALTTKPGGMCAFCGTGITNLFNIESSDGKKFHVGCDCVLKTGDRRLVSAVNAAVAKAAKAKRLNKAVDVQAELVRILNDDAARATLGAALHPSGEGCGSLLDYVEWMNQRAGAAGRYKALKMVKKVISS